MTAFPYLNGEHSVLERNNNHTDYYHCGAPRKNGNLLMTAVMIGRERELEELGAVAALRTVKNERGERICEEPAPLVVVYGGASTGKSMCVAQALRRHADIYTMVDCTAIYSAQEFYRETLVQLYKNQARLTHGTSPLAAANESTTGVESEEQVTIEDEQKITDAAQAGAKKTGGTGGGDGSGASSHNDGESESESSDREGNDQEEKSAWQSRKQNAISRAKCEREHHREQQQQRDAEARESRVTYEGYNSLNFLSFIKALGIFMDVVAKQQKEDAENGDNGYGQQQRKRVVYLALDQVDKLLDRGLAPLLTCIFTVSDQLAYLNMFSDVQWDVSVLLITRAISLEFDHLVSSYFPAYIAFSPYTDGTRDAISLHRIMTPIADLWYLYFTAAQVADILVDQLCMQPVARTFRKWLLHLSTLVPPSQDDWLEFRRNVVHLLPDFKAYFTLVATTTNNSIVAAPALPNSTPLLAKDVTQKVADKQMKKLMRETNTRVGTFQKTRRKHLFGYDKLQRSGGDPTDTITCTDLSRSCLLLIIAGFLASFNPQDTDTNFLSSSGGVRRKKRVKKTGQSSAAAAEQISQLLIGPRIFTLQRLLAIYLNLRAEASADLSDRFIVNEAREDIFTHLATLVRMQLFQRTSPPNMLDDIKLRCLADSRFVQETAKYLRFPLESYLNTAT